MNRGAADRNDDRGAAALAPLMARIAAGDETAFSALYERTHAKLFGICRRILNDAGLAEEVLQEVYVTVWQRARTYDPGKASPVAWMAVIARNRAIDRLRKADRGAHESDAALADLASDEPSPFDRLSASDERRRLQDCLRQLDVRRRKVIAAAFYTGVTYAVLAERAGVPLGTIKTWVRRGLLQLRDCLDR